MIDVAREVRSGHAGECEAEYLVSARQLTSCLVPKNFQNFLSHRMFGHMHEVLNIDEKKLITQFGRKPRDNLLSLISP
jgi:hypothetical protein